MLDKVQFPIRVLDDKTRGIIYLHGTGVTLDDLKCFTLELFPSICPIFYTSLKQYGMTVDYFSYVRDKKETYVSITTSLHLFKLYINKDGKYRFNVYDYDKAMYTHQYDLSELVDHVSEDLLSSMFESSEDIDVCSSMMNVLYTVIVNRFIINK